ncbi:uncharacterized protein V6R79_013587 [Siganus canaliculatus]
MRTRAGGPDGGGPDGGGPEVEDRTVEDRRVEDPTVEDRTVEDRTVEYRRWRTGPCCWFPVRGPSSVSLWPVFNRDVRSWTSSSATSSL